MSAPHEVWKHVEQLVGQRAPKNPRFRKLRGTEAKPAVIKGATARLLAPDAVFPYALRKRLAPRRVIGNLSLRPVDPTLWEAWLTVHRNYIEHGRFWFEELDAAKRKLIDNAIDAERQAVIKATSVSGGDSAAAAEALARYTEAGQAYAREPTREIEQEKLEADEAAALEYRKQIEAEENTKLRQAVEAYGRTLRREQRRALNLICFEPKRTGAKIAVRCRVSEATVSKIRANVEELADKILTIAPEEGSAVESSPAAAPLDEPLPLVNEPEALGADEVIATGKGKGDAADLDLSKTALSSEALNIAWELRAPDVDADDASENVMRSYARHKSTSAFMRDNWSGGRRRFSDVELVTGSRYGGRYDDPAKIVQRDERKQHANNFSDVEMRELRQKAAAADFAINKFLRAIDSFLTKRAAESVDELMSATILPKAGD